MSVRDAAARVMAAAERVIDTIDAKLWEAEQREQWREQHTVPTAQVTRHERIREAGEQWQRKAER